MKWHPETKNNGFLYDICSGLCLGLPQDLPATVLYDTAARDKCVVLDWFECAIEEKFKSVVGTETTCHAMSIRDEAAQLRAGERLLRTGYTEECRLECVA